MAKSQLSENGLPESFILGLKNATLLPTMQLDSVQQEKMLKSNRELSIDNRYGVVKPCHIDIKKEGISTLIEGKGTIWQYKIQSKDGCSLGLYFEQYYLPPKAKVFIYNSSRSQLMGAFTSRNNHPSEHHLPIAEFPGKDLIIEYFEPFSAEFSGDLVLGEISQAYIDINDHLVSALGINCDEGTNWQTEKKSVCLITFHDKLFSYYCTGTLVNNARVDMTPYFLTANHCIRNELMANSMITYFNYENSSCDSNDAVFKQTLAGATLKAGNRYSDFSLLLLNEYPPEEYHPFYAGWDARGEDPLQGACIHHPNGKPKSLAIDSLPITAYPGKAQWSYDSFATLPDTHWSANFILGTVELGSSGAPLFDQEKHLVGQLHGGTESVFLYGKFSLSWNHNPQPKAQLAHWLDPDSTNCKVLDGTWSLPPKTEFHSRVQRICPNTPLLLTDETTLFPIEWHWSITPKSYYFTDNTDSTSQNPQVVFTREGYYTVTLKATNTHGSTELTKQNYILVKRNMGIKFTPLPQNNEICGCDLKSFPIIAKGSLLYDFTAGKPGEIDIKHTGDTLYLTLNLNAGIRKSFDAWLKVIDSNKNCAADDSMLLHIIIPPNDSIKNASLLQPGQNKGYFNHCATVEKNEPHPYSANCWTRMSWCPNISENYNILNNSIWFNFIGPPGGELTINTKGFDNQIAVYEAIPDSSYEKGPAVQYNLIAANDNRSSMNAEALIENMSLKPGKQYLLQVDGNNGDYGPLEIELLTSSIEVFPNPSHGIFNLRITNVRLGTADILVSDINGRKILNKQYKVTYDSNHFNLDLSQFKKGVYFLNVLVNGTTLMQKLVLM